jgi:hypothetical protein
MYFIIIMKRTIVSSFLFLIPINLCYYYADIFHLNINVICFGLSVANHSHNFFTHDLLRKNIIRVLDEFFNLYNILYTSYSGLNNMNCYAYCSINLMIISYIYFRYLRYTKNENYTNEQKTIHALWHFLSISLLSHYKCACMNW